MRFYMNRSKGRILLDLDGSIDRVDSLAARMHAVFARNKRAGLWWPGCVRAERRRRRRRHEKNRERAGGRGAVFADLHA
jgi:hypothetical protein